MDKRYQVFVSSTFADLQDERQAVMQALLSLDHFPAGMELFPATDDDQWALIQGVIDDSDYYVLVIGGRYGSVSDNGVSYTEMEFDYALAKGIPVLAFLHAEPEEIAAKNTDQNDVLRERLQKFRKKAQTGRTVKFFSNPDQLKAHVIQSVSAETKRNPREGWVRVNDAGDPATMEALRKEIDRLKSELGSAGSQPPEGSQQYAGGADKTKLEFSYWYNRVTQYATGAISWNNIFKEVAPSMMEEASERQMKSRLSEELPLYLPATFPEGASMFSLGNDSFETIKVQLFALGLIAKSEKKHVPSDTNRYWTLTPYGQSLLMKLRAIKKVTTVGDLSD